MSKHYEFSKERAAEISDLVNELWTAMGPKKSAQYAGHANEIFLFLDAAKAQAPAREVAPPSGVKGI